MKHVTINIPRFPQRLLGGHLYVEYVVRNLLEQAGSDFRFTIQFAGLKQVKEQYRKISEIDSQRRSIINWVPLPPSAMDRLYQVAGRLKLSDGYAGRSVLHNFGSAPLLFPSGNMVLTIQDVIPFRELEGEGSIAIRQETKKQLTMLAKHARVIITISDFSRAELIDSLGVDPGKVVVIPDGVDLQTFVPLKAQCAEAARSTLSRLGVQTPYLLSIGGGVPRKNLVRLVDAFDLLKSKHKIEHSLVLAGGEPTAALIERCARSPFQDSIHLLGYLPQADIVSVLQLADVYVFPSYYEGFGLPSLEAMACGVPVVSSRAASLPEVGGDAAIYFDPFDIESIAGVVVELLADDTLRQVCIQKGLARSATCDWKRNAKATLDLYDRLMTSESV